MAGFNYSKAQQTALGLITKFGTDTTIAETSETYDPVEGATSAGTVTKQTATVVSLSASEGIAYFGDRFREELLTGSVRFFYIAAVGLDFAPEPGQLILWEGKLWDISGTNPLSPSGIPVIYNLGCTLSQKDPSILDDISAFPYILPFNLA